MWCRGCRGCNARLQVLFDEHTDSSLLTLSLLCPGAAGLELRDLLGREGGDGEAEAQGEGEEGVAWNLPAGTLEQPGKEITHKHYTVKISVKASSLC